METLGVEGVGVVVWGFLIDFSTDGNWIEPKIPSTRTSVGGFVGSVLGRGA